MKMNRRKFIYGTVFGTAGALSAKSWGQVAGANGEIRHAVIGFGGRGKDHIEGVRLVALCDVDSKVINREMKRLEEYGKPIETFVDIRKLLESKNIDTVSIATPNHWHALGAIWSIQAGKDVYLEKPVSHNVWEGRKIVEATDKYKKIVQTGTQARSSTAIKEAVEWVRGGK